jgi:hypothetical protein
MGMGSAMGSVREDAGHQRSVIVSRHSEGREEGMIWHHSPEALTIL